MITSNTANKIKKQWNILFNVGSTHSFWLAKHILPQMRETSHLMKGKTDVVCNLRQNGNTLMNTVHVLETKIPQLLRCNSKQNNCRQLLHFRKPIRSFPKYRNTFHRQTLLKNIFFDNFSIFIQSFSLSYAFRLQPTALLLRSVPVRFPKRLWNFLLILKQAIKVFWVDAWANERHFITTSSILQF